MNYFCTLNCVSIEHPKPFFLFSSYGHFVILILSTDRLGFLTRLTSMFSFLK